MNDKGFWIYLLILCGSTYLIRAIPFAAARKKITNTFIRSFLHYIPYTVLAAMTFPAALYATDNVISAAAGLAVGMIFALLGKGLTTVAVVSCLGVFITDLIVSSPL
ncbi:MAG: AzlD domain-containing protein [Clostridia bacterium]|nr:AzlD domain-containing protein [Clostridia bacterium]